MEIALIDFKGHSGDLLPYLLVIQYFAHGMNFRKGKLGQFALDSKHFIDDYPPHSGYSGNSGTGKDGYTLGLTFPVLHNLAH